MIPHPRSAEHYARVARERIDGEPILKAIHRIMVEDAVAATGSQKEAAKLLGVTGQAIFHCLQKKKEKLVNVRLGRAQANSRTGAKWTPERFAARDARLAERKEASA
jgi:predicted transcriptional regulator